MAKLRAEYFWTDRWLSSSAVMLSLECRGLYREMLTLAWSQGASLPNDHEEIQRALRITASEWKRSWPAVKRYWRVSDGRLINDVQREVYAQSVQRQAHASERAQKRWGNQRKMQMPHMQGVQMQGVHMQGPHMPMDPDPDQELEQEQAGTSTARARRKRQKTGKPVEKSRRQPQ